LEREKKCDTVLLPIVHKASPATTGNQKEQYFQPIGKEENVENIF
jgi:hypothetical protein